jgi:hypothetical protein
MSPDPAPDPDPGRIADDLAEVRRTGVTLDGEVVQVAESTWAVYGRTTYDGEVIVGEYHDAAEAWAVLRAEEPDPLT